MKNITTSINATISSFGCATVWLHGIGGDSGYIVCNENKTRFTYQNWSMLREEVQLLCLNAYLRATENQEHDAVSFLHKKDNDTLHCIVVEWYAHREVAVGFCKEYNERAIYDLEHDVIIEL